jgi:peptidoglycan/xylan/chitin deacetylase (PgdA/CDA1 family)
MPPARLLFYFATAAGIALSVFSIAYEPPPLWIALTALFLYLNLCVWGVIFSRFSMFADVVTFGPRDARGVALTFDDGPDPRSTPEILDMLDQAEAKATFFVIGHKAEEHPDLVEEIAERGHAIGVHSYAHNRLFSLQSPKRVRADLQRTIDVLQRITGERPRLFRAPIGHISPSIARVSRQLELDTIGWSVRGVDGWKGAKPEAVANKVVRGLRDGAIVMLHDAAERGDFIPASVKALPRILEVAEEKQLSFVRVDRWLGQGGAGAVAEAHDAAS